VEKIFLISLVNVDLPLVLSLHYQQDNNSKYKFYGEVLNNGGITLSELGIEISEKTNFSDPIRLQVDPLTETAGFSTDFHSLDPQKRYYYRAFALNSAGNNYGAIKVLITQSSKNSWWSNSTEATGGWRTSDWFGNFRPFENGWIYHSHLEWVFASSDGSGGLWLWLEPHGWLWTKQDVWPYLWKHNDNQWLFLIKGSPGISLLYNYAGKYWYSSDGQIAEHYVKSSKDLKMLWVSPGSFRIGSEFQQSAAGDTRHQVTFTEGFYLGKYEVTQEQYREVMTGNSKGLNASPSRWQSNKNQAVEKVSWLDAMEFCSILTEKEHAAGRLTENWIYTLPTESEWEFACRSNTSTTFSWGDTINPSDANYRSSGNARTLKVGQYNRNPWGFYDMHGNVAEWTFDWHGAYQAAALINPSGPNSGKERVVRGGSWDSPSKSLHSAKRMKDPEDKRSNQIGFRICYKKAF
jgi:formylglycine-generating enzyme required for sulfatase activity